MTRFKNGSYSKVNGATYTPQILSEFLSRELTNLSTIRTGIVRILDPALGDGQLIESILDRLSEIESLKIHVTAFEIDAIVLAKASERLINKYRNVVFEFVDRDFIEEYSSGELRNREFDYIVGNPPYIRAQIIGAQRLQKLAKTFGLKGKFDLSFVFIIIACQLLSEGGVCGFIISNKFMVSKSGEELRNFLLENISLNRIVDFGDTRLFAASVLPCVLTFKKGQTDPGKVRFTSTYQFTTHLAEEAKSVIDVINRQGAYYVGNKFFSISQGILSISSKTGVWALSNPEAKQWLDVVEKNTFCCFKDVGQVNVGIKTAADPVFLMKKWLGAEEDMPELMRPLIGSVNAGHYFAGTNAHEYVVYPHASKDGKCCPLNLDMYPKTKQYLEMFHDNLCSRAFIKKDNFKKWFEIQVHHNPDSWNRRKIVFRDIAGKPEFWLDETGAVVKGNCYWIEIRNDLNDDLLYLMLGVANSSFIEKYYDMTVNNKLYSGKRRFMKQYVENFPIPDPDTIEAKEIALLVKKAIDTKSLADKGRIDYLVGRLFEGQPLVVTPSISLQGISFSSHGKKIS